MAESTRMDLKEAAEHSGRSIGTLRAWIRYGRLPAIKEGNRYFVLPGELDAAVTLLDDDAERAMQETITRLVEEAPPLSPERRNELRRILMR